MRATMNRIWKHVKLMAAVSVLAVLGVGLAYGLTAPVSAAPRDEVCKGVNLGGGSCNDDGSSINKVIKLVVNILSVIAGVAAVVMIVVGGLKYITSGGDTSKVAGAKTSILYAIVGLVIVALAQVIVRFVLNKATQ